MEPIGYEIFPQGVNMISWDVGCPKDDYSDLHTLSLQKNTFLFSVLVSRDMILCYTIFTASQLRHGITVGTVEVCSLS